MLVAEQSIEQVHERVLTLEETNNALDSEVVRLKRGITETQGNLSEKARTSEESAMGAHQTVTVLKQQLAETSTAYEQANRDSVRLRQRYDILWSEHQEEKKLRLETEDTWRKKQAHEIAALQRDWEDELHRCRQAEEEAVELLRAQEDFWAQKDEDYVRGKDGLVEQIERLRRQNTELRLSQVA